MIAEWITNLAGNNPQATMLLLVLLFTIIGDFIEPVPTIIIFMPLVNALTQAADINPVHVGAVLIATLAFGLRGQIFASPAGGAANLLRFPDHDHVHDLLSEGRALAAEASAS